MIDSYALPRDAYSAVRRVRPTLAIVDGDPAQKDGHVIVDQNIGAEADDWPLPEGTVRLAGLDYALMRDEIRASRTGRHRPLRPLRCAPSRSSAAPTRSAPLRW